MKVIRTYEARACDFCQKDEESCRIYQCHICGKDACLEHRTAVPVCSLGLIALSFCQTCYAHRGPIVKAALAVQALEAERTAFAAAWEPKQEAAEAELQKLLDRLPRGEG